MDSICISINCQRSCKLINNNIFSKFCSVHNRKIVIFYKNLHNNKYLINLINKCLSYGNKIVLLQDTYKNIILGINLLKNNIKNKITKKNKDKLIMGFKKLIINKKKKILLKKKNLFNLGFFLN